jgi:hypothetical protein
LKGKLEQSAKPTSNRQPPTSKQVFALSFFFKLKRSSEVNRLITANIIAIAPSPVNPNTNDNAPNMAKNIALYFKTCFSSMILQLKVPAGIYCFTKQLIFFLIATFLNKFLFHPCKINSLFQME